MIELTEDQRREVDAAGGGPIRVRVPRTGREYVLLSADLYEQLQSLMDEFGDVTATAELVDRVMAEDDANDPYLASYQSIQQEGRP